MTRRRILIFGDFRPGRLAASYECAFRELGHEVFQFDAPRAAVQLAWPARNRILHRASIRSMSLRRRWSQQFNRTLVNCCQSAGADWVFITNGEWLMPETVCALKAGGARVAIFHADNPFPPHYNNRPETLALAREADLYLVWSEKLVRKLYEIGVRSQFLSFGWDQNVFPFQGGTPQGSWPGVVFIGGWDREREVFMEEVAVHVPLRIYGPAYWGTRTRRNGRARVCWQGCALEMSDAARVVRESAVCLNVLRTQHRVDGDFDGVIMRHFEVPGAGGFLLSTRSGVATRLFPEGATGAYFGTVQECIEACKYYLRCQDERHSRVAAAHREVASGHTYTQRAREVEKMLLGLG